MFVMLGTREDIFLFIVKDLPAFPLIEKLRPIVAICLLLVMVIIDFDFLKKNANSW